MRYVKTKRDIVEINNRFCNSSNFFSSISEVCGVFSPSEEIKASVLSAPGKTNLFFSLLDKQNYKNVVFY